MVGEEVARFVAESNQAEEEGTAKWPEAAEHMVAVALEDIGNQQAAAVGGRKEGRVSSQAAAAAHIAAADRHLEDTPAGQGQRLEDTPAGEGRRFEDMRAEVEQRVEGTPAGEQRCSEDTPAAEGQHQGSSLPAEDTVPRTEAAHREVGGRTAGEAVAAPDTAHIAAAGAAGSPKNRDSEDIPAARTLVLGAAAVGCWAETAEVVGAGHMPSHEGAAEVGAEGAEGAEAGDEEGEEGEAVVEVGEAAAAAEAEEGEDSA